MFAYQCQPVLPGLYNISIWRPLSLQLRSAESHSQSGQVTVEVKRMRCKCIEIYKSLNGLNPSHVNDIFSGNLSLYSSRRSHDLSVPRVNQTTFGLKTCFRIFTNWSIMADFQSLKYCIVAKML